MKITNLNSKFDLTPAQISFFESVALNGKSNRMVERPISYYLDKIPVFLTDIPTIDQLKGNEPDPFENIDTGTVYEKNYNPDALGLYINEGEVLGVKSPCIVLCVEKIVNWAESEEELIVLIAKVLIHEFAHAVMADEFQAEKNQSRDTFYVLLEESMANQMTLEYFESFEKDIQRNKMLSERPAYATTIKNSYEIVKNFVFQQPAQYRLGLFFHTLNCGFHWNSWMKNKSTWQKSVVKNELFSHIISNYRDFIQHESSFTGDKKREEERIYELERENIREKLEVLHARICGKVVHTYRVTAMKDLDYDLSKSNCRIHEGDSIEIETVSNINENPNMYRYQWIRKFDEEYGNDWSNSHHSIPLFESDDVVKVEIISSK
jgi:hypothetical protein